MPGVAREWMVPGGAHGLQTRWGAACVVPGGFDSLPLPPLSLSSRPRGAHNELMHQPMHRYRYQVRRGPAFGFPGLLILVGVLALLNNLDILDLGYVFGLFWPGILIIMGLGMLRAWPKTFGLFLTLLGAIFFAQNLDVLPQSWDLGRLWPLFLVGFGVSSLLRRRRVRESHVEL